MRVWLENAYSCFVWGSFGGVKIGKMEAFCSFIPPGMHRTGIDIQCIKQHKRLLCGLVSIETRSITGVKKEQKSNLTKKASPPHVDGIPYTSRWSVRISIRIISSHVGSGSPSKTWFLCSIRGYTRKGISIS